MFLDDDFILPSNIEHPMTVGYIVISLLVYFLVNYLISDEETTETRNVSGVDIEGSDVTLENKTWFLSCEFIPMKQIIDSMTRTLEKETTCLKDDRTHVVGNKVVFQFPEKSMAITAREKLHDQMDTWSIGFRLETALVDADAFRYCSRMMVDHIRPISSLVNEGSRDQSHQEDGDAPDPDVQIGYRNHREIRWQKPNQDVLIYDSSTPEKWLFDSCFLETSGVTLKKSNLRLAKMVRNIRISVKVFASPDKPMRRDIVVKSLIESFIRQIRQPQSSHRVDIRQTFQRVVDVFNDEFTNRRCQLLVIWDHL